MVKLTEKQKKDYINAISKQIFDKEYDTITDEEKIVIDVNLIQRLRIEEFTQDEYDQLRAFNIHL